MRCRLIGDRVACYCGGSGRYQFVVKKSCGRWNGEGPDYPEQVAITGCIHRSSSPEPIPANCGCAGIKNLDLYQCELHGDCAKDATTFERIKVTRRNNGESEPVKSCCACRDRAAVGAKPTTLHVITSLFNPADSWRIRDNYRRFRESINAPMTVVEMLLSGQSPMAADSVVIPGDRGRNTLFQKERLLNVALEHVPPEADAIAWIDADVIFEREDWQAAALDMLKDYHVGQLWSDAVWENADGSDEERFMSAAWKHQTNSAGYGHPGFAWMARADFLRSIGGLWQEECFGGGDSWMVHAFTGKDSVTLPTFLAPTSGMAASFARWAAKVSEHGCRLGCVSGTIRHLYHGSRANRQYTERHKHRYDYNPATDVRIGESGLLEWTGNNPRAQEYMASYFGLRRDDE